MTRTLRPSSDFQTDGRTVVSKRVVWGPAEPTFKPAASRQHPGGLYQQLADTAGPLWKPVSCTGAVTEGGSLGQIPEELLSTIVDKLSLPDLTALVRVSQNLWRIGVPLVWRDLDDEPFLMLIRSMQLDIIVLNQQCVLGERVPRTLHASMVRTLELEFSGARGQEIAALLHYLHASGHAQILPHLHALSITVTQVPLGGLCLNPLLSPTMEWLRLVFETETEPLGAPDTAVDVFIQMVEVVKDLPLKTLSISTADESLKSSIAASEAIGRLISRHPDLTRIEVNDFYRRLLSPFVAASRIPLLREAEFSTLSFSSPNTNITALPGHHGAVHIPRFMALEALAVDLASRDVEDILAFVRSAPLTSLRLRLEHPGPTINQSLRRVEWFQGLKSVTLWFPNSQGEWKDLIPLLSCTQLCAVDLHGVGIAKAIGNTEIMTMAGSWPGLQKLWLRDIHGEGGNVEGVGGPSQSPLLTLLGVSRVAALCHELTMLAAPVDARQPTLNHPDAGIGPNVQHLWFPGSVLDGNEAQVAQFIANHWPNHAYPRASPLLGIPEMEDGDPWKNVWRMADTS